MDDFIRELTGEFLSQYITDDLLLFMKNNLHRELSKMNLVKYRGLDVDSDDEVDPSEEYLQQRDKIFKLISSWVIPSIYNEYDNTDDITDDNGVLSDMHESLYQLIDSFWDSMIIENVELRNSLPH